MNSNKSPLSTILFAVALLFFTVATFAMFGAVVTKHDASAIGILNMFQAAFGVGGVGQSRVSGLTAIFVLQLIILVGVVSIFVGIFTRKFNNIILIVIYSLVCLCSIIAFIISFNAKDLYLSVNSPGQYRGDYTLGPGPIAYSVLHIIGLVASAAGLVMSRRGA